MPQRHLVLTEVNNSIYFMRQFAINEPAAEAQKKSSIECKGSFPVRSCSFIQA